MNSLRNGEGSAQLEAYAQSEKPLIKDTSAVVFDTRLTPEKKALQAEVRTGTVSRLDVIIEKINASDEIDPEGELLQEITDSLAHDQVLDYRDKYTVETYELLEKKIHEIGGALERKGIYRRDSLKVNEKLNELTNNIENNKWKVAYIFDPIELRTEIFDDFRTKMKELKDLDAPREDIQALKDRTKEKLALSIELLSQLQEGFTQAYQDLFPRLADKIEEDRDEDNPYPKLGEWDTLNALEIGLVSHGITTNVYRNNIKDHLVLLTDTHNKISNFLESFSTPLDGQESYLLMTRSLFGKEIMPRGKVNLVLDPPYNEVVIECEDPDDYSVLRSENGTLNGDSSGGVHYRSLDLSSGDGKRTFLPVSVIRGSSSKVRKHETAHAIQNQYKETPKGWPKKKESIAANREVWVSVFGVTVEDVENGAAASDSEKQWQIFLAVELNSAITMSRNEIQAYTRDGSSTERMASVLQDTGPEALYDYLNIEEIRTFLKDNHSGEFSDDEELQLKKDIGQIRYKYYRYLQDSIGVVDNYLRLLGSGPDVRETASTMVRFTTLTEVKDIVSLLEERDVETLTYDPSLKVVDALQEIDSDLGEEFVKNLSEWKKIIEEIKSNDSEGKDFQDIIGMMRWNRFSPENGSIKSLSNVDSLLILDKPTVDLNIDSKDQLVKLFTVLGIISPGQDLDDFIGSLPSGERTMEGYQYEGIVMHNVPTKINGLSVSTNLNGFKDGHFSVGMNFDLKTFHLMMNQIGLHL